MRTNIENHTGLIVSNMAWNSVNVNDTDRQRTERTNKMRHATNQVNEPLSHLFGAFAVAVFMSWYLLWAYALMH